MDRVALTALKRPQLQRLAKQNRLRGNLKSAELVDLLAAHYEKQKQHQKRMSGSPSPAASSAHSHQQTDENREPQLVGVNAVLAADSKVPSLPLDLASIDLQPNQPLSTRISALESLCTRLISHATASATTIAALQGRLEAAETHITTLNATLEDTRSQLEASRTEVRSLRSSLAATDSLATETSTVLVADVAAVRAMAESVGNRLSQAEDKWQADLAAVERQITEPEDKMLFEPPTFPPKRASSHSRRSVSRETSGSTLSWAQNQQAIAGAPLGIPSVRLFGAGSIADEMDLDEDVINRPGTSSSARNRLAPSLMPPHDTRVTGAVPGPSGSSRKPSLVVDPLAADPFRQGPSSRAAGKRPASPIQIPVNLKAETDTIRAAKRTRHASGNRSGEPSHMPEESPSLNSLSAGASISTADSPVFPPSPSGEPSTPPSKRVPTLLPPVEIMSTPSPSTRKDYGDSHGFATAPRPPMEGPSSPTLDSPRRNLSRRFKVDPSPSIPPPPLAFPSEITASESTRKQGSHARRTSIASRHSVAPTSPTTLMIGKGKVLQASLDPETASGARSRPTSEEPDPESDITMTPVPSTSTVPVEPAAPPKRHTSFFSSASIRPDFASSGSYVSTLAPPPPPPHNGNNYRVVTPARRLGSAPLLTAAPPAPAPPPRNWGADPDEDLHSRPSTTTTANSTRPVVPPPGRLSLWRLGR